MTKLKIIYMVSIFILVYFFNLLNLKATEQLPSVESFSKSDTSLNSRIYSYDITANSITIVQTSSPSNTSRIILSRNVVGVIKTQQLNLYIYIDFEGGRREELSFYSDEEIARNSVYDAIIRIWGLR